MFIEEVAVGMHHVAAVASKLHANGRLPEEGRRSRLLTWGKGAAGQLGNEVSRDFNSPQVCISAWTLDWPKRLVLRAANG
jgi:hypothetical protein